MGFFFSFSFINITLVCCRAFIPMYSLRSRSRTGNGCTYYMKPFFFFFTFPHQQAVEMSLSHHEALFYFILFFPPRSVEFGSFTCCTLWFKPFLFVTVNRKRK